MLSNHGPMLSIRCGLFACPAPAWDIAGSARNRRLADTELTA
jgi:hypothetical protein